ncbi:MAG TPA: VCBS repeat-containing protein [Opitutaceae bacterium]|nr:VCBS repeat-containing protein [Opitutaceae bacterium]
MNLPHSLPRRAWTTALAFPLAATLAAAAVPGYRTDLTDNAVALLTRKFLYNQYHVMQSFAFNNANGDIYVAQVEGSDSLGTWSEHWANGDLELTRLSSDGNTILGHMDLEGFGHGVSIGIEPVGSAVYVWTEVDSQPNSEGSGRGTKLGRFLFTNGVTLDHTDSAITKYSPVSGVTQVTPSVNLAEGLLLERYLTASNQFRLALFRLADVKAGGTPTPLRDIAIPTGLGTFEGDCTYGNHVYLYTGTAYSDTNPPPGNAELYCLDWDTGQVVQQAHTDAFGDQIYREPEGMAVRLDGAGQPKLCFGFSSSVSSTDGRRVISIAFKQAQVFDALASGPSVFAPDFDGDGVADYSVWRSLTGKWYWKNVSTGATGSAVLGSVGDVPVPGDFDGDGRADAVTWDPATATWSVLQSSTGTVATRVFGQAGDIPVAGDFDGDRRADFAVWRPSNGTWYVILSSTGVTVTQPYGAAGDVPTPGDYDGDGRTDYSTWRPGEYWHVIYSATGTHAATAWGIPGDVPVPGDYDGDGKTDLAQWRPATAKWYVIRSSTGASFSQVFGATGDSPVAADFDGDGKTDFAVWRPSNGTWYLLKSSNGSTVSASWGLAGDTAVP